MAQVVVCCITIKSWNSSNHG